MKLTIDGGEVPVADPDGVGALAPMRAAQREILLWIPNHGSIPTVSSGCARSSARTPHGSPFAASGASTAATTRAACALSGAELDLSAASARWLHHCGSAIVFEDRRYSVLGPQEAGVVVLGGALGILVQTLKKYTI